MRQLPLTLTDHVPLRPPFIGCSRNPSRYGLQDTRAARMMPPERQLRKMKRNTLRQQPAHFLQNSRGLWLDEQVDAERRRPRDAAQTHRAQIVLPRERGVAKGCQDSRGRSLERGDVAVAAQ